MFEQYASEHPRREQALNVWEYLTRIYKQDSLFSVQKRPIREIEKEKQRIKAEDDSFLASLNKNSYLHWYLPTRKLVGSASTIAQYRSLEAPATIKAFRELDYSDDRLYKSGILRESIENHFWLIENSLGSLETAYVAMQTSIDSMIDQLIMDEKKLNEITDFLFKLLEKRSLFKASEYLAIKVLNQDACSIDVGLASKLESYRAMKIGNTAPDFEFKGDILSPGYTSEKTPKKLSDIHSDYTVLVFGSSWCPACPKELMQIVSSYQNWKSNGVEVVFVSLDEEQEQFKSFSNPFPFVSVSDYQKWESPIVKSYHVFATPTIFLLDNKQEIILRPNSTTQVDAWIDWYLVKGNK